jgi:hypothetical protein
MTHRLSAQRLTLGLGLFLVAAAALAQPAQKAYEPQVGQEGKDVVWVPTSQALVDRMLDIAKVTPQDFVMDLGSGDGRTVISAAKRGARALGIEYNPSMVELSRRNAQQAGVADRAAFEKADLFGIDLSRATVITMFLLPDINLKLRPKILDLTPGTRVVSNTFTMGEWKDDQTAAVEDNAQCSYYCTAHLWIVPAKVDGSWQLGQGEVILRQHFQTFTGTLTNSDKNAQVTGGTLRGDQISFKAGESQYTGRVMGNRMEGTVKTGTSTANWSATLKVGHN